MSVFEDLIDELKNENLLEETVIDSTRPNPGIVPTSSAAAATSETAFEQAGRSAEAEMSEAEPVDLPVIEKPANEREFFRKRAMDEVSSLQMVEHVFSGVEREYMKTDSVPFDDLNAKKALHRFMQVSEDVKAPEHAEAELALRQETEAWGYALYERDQKISVDHLRRFCEESRPVLSSQALIALARFYRNSPYSENVRSKFEFVMTRLFTRETADEKRTFLFAHNEMVGHIKTLYANWSSIALYTEEDDQVEVSLTVTRFDEFTIEVEGAETFDELLASDFFIRVRSYKEGAAEMFYVPEVVAASIKCNLAIGNRYVDLISQELSKFSLEQLQEKYGETHDDVVSQASCKSLSVEAVSAIDTAYENADQPAETAPVERKKRSVESTDSTGTIDLLGVNKWLMIVCIVCVLISGGAYMWADQIAGGEGDTPVATPVMIDDPEIVKYVGSPRASNETLYAVTLSSYDSLSAEEKEALLAKLQQFASSQKFTKVSLLNSQGKSVAYASNTRTEIVAR